MFTKGHILSEETKKKIGEASKGRHHTEESKEKMSEIAKGNKKWLGKHHSEESRQKISITHTGMHPSEESRKKMSESHKGQVGFYKGKHLSSETRKKISESLKGRVAGMKGKCHSIETRKKLSEAHKGKCPSKETRRKMSEARKGEKSWKWKGGLSPLTEQIRKCFEYRQWRSDIFTRDDYTCVLCGKRGGGIVADHYPKDFKDIFYDNKIQTLEEALNCEEFWNINNGRTLCLECHDRKTYAKGSSRGKSISKSLKKYI